MSRRIIRKTKDVPKKLIEKKNAMTSGINTSKLEIEKLQEESKDKTSQIKKIDKIISEKENELKALVLAIDKYKKDNEIVRQESLERKANLDTLKIEIKDLEEQKKLKVLALEEIKENKLDILDREIKEKEKEKTIAQKDSVTLIVRRNKLDVDISNLTSRLSVKESVLENLENNVRDHIKEISSLEEKVETLKGDIIDLEDEKIVVDKLGKDKLELQESLKELRRENMGLDQIKREKLAEVLKREDIIIRKDEQQKQRDSYLDDKEKELRVRMETIQRHYDKMGMKINLQI